MRTGGWLTVGRQLLRADRQPHPRREPVGELVMGERREQAHDGLRDQQRGLGERIMLAYRAVRQLIEPSAELDDRALAPRDNRLPRPSRRSVREFR